MISLNEGKKKWVKNLPGVPLVGFEEIGSAVVLFDFKRTSFVKHTIMVS